MIGVFLEPGFSARELFEMAFRAFRPTLLQALAKTMMPLAVALDKLPAERLILAVRSQVDDAEIDTQRSARCNRRWRRHIKRYRQIACAIAVDEISLSFDGIHTGRLIRAKQERDKHAGSLRQEGHRRQSFEGHHTGVIDESALWIEMRLDALITLVGFTRFTDGTDSQLSREPVGSTQFAIHQLLQLKFVGTLLSKSHRGHKVSRFVKDVHGVKQGLMLFRCGCQFQEHRLFHRTSILPLSILVTRHGYPGAHTPNKEAAFPPLP